jgi:hypothetical protein
MGDVVNLRTIRKRAARARDAQSAEENRVLHGRSKAERQLAEARGDKARRNLDQHRIDNGDES